MFRKAPQFTVEFAVRVSPPFLKKNKKKNHFPKAWLAKLCGGGGNSIFFIFLFFLWHLWPFGHLRLPHCTE